MWLFCFDVKLRNLDMRFDNLLGRYRAATPGHESMTGNPEWVTACHKNWDAAIGEDKEKNTWLYNTSLELAKQDFVSPSYDHTIVPFRTYNNPLKPVYQFMGASGGWLVLASFDGRVCSYSSMGDYLRHVAHSNERFENAADTIKELAKVLLELADFTRGNGPEREIETQAACMFFDALCADIAEPYLAKLEVQRQENMRQAFLRSLIEKAKPGRKLNEAAPTEAAWPLLPRRRVDVGDRS